MLSIQNKHVVTRFSYSLSNPISCHVDFQVAYLNWGELSNFVEDLLEKTVQSLPNEIDSANRRKWDLIVVSQFLREVKDAKKRGRKERRHREAKAVMAEATAAAATTSRNSAPRKDSKDDTPATTNKEVLYFYSYAFFNFPFFYDYVKN
jgi:hypothetical protein